MELAVEEYLREPLKIGIWERQEINGELTMSERREQPCCGLWPDLRRGQNT